MTDNSARKSGIVATDLRRPASMIWPSGPVSDPGEDWAALREAARPKAGGDIFAEVDAALKQSWAGNRLQPDVMYIAPWPWALMLAALEIRWDLFGIRLRRRARQIHKRLEAELAAEPQDCAL